MNSRAHFRYLAVVLLAACGPSGGQSDAALTVTLLGAAYPVSQIVRRGDRGYFTLVFPDTTSHRYYASYSRAAFSGIEWETIDAPDGHPTFPFAPSDSVLFRKLCG